MGDAILRIPRDARVRAYRTRDTYDGVVPATSKRQPYCHSSYIELSGPNAYNNNGRHCQPRKNRLSALNSSDDKGYTIFAETLKYTGKPIKETRFGILSISSNMIIGYIFLSL